MISRQENYKIFIKFSKPKGLTPQHLVRNHVSKQLQHEKSEKKKILDCGPACSNAEIHVWRASVPLHKKHCQSFRGRGEGIYFCYFKGPQIISSVQDNLANCRHAEGVGGQKKRKTEI